MTLRRADAERRPPRLVLRFTLFTGAALAIASAVIFVMVRGFVTTQARNAVAQNTRFVAEAVLSRQLRPADFDGRLSAARRTALERLFRNQVMIDDVEGAALYAPNGRETFTTARRPDAVPPVAVPEDAIRETLDGQEIRSTVGTSSAGDGSSRTVLRQLVPIWFGDRAAGVLVTERDYAPIESSVRATFIPIALVLEGLLLALFVSLFPVLRRATRQIDSHMDEIEHQALHDSLTGLPNRVLFNDRIEVALANARRGGGRAAVLLLDLDGFKEINDALGHASGDDLLRELSTRLRSTLRDTDTVARLGGDEFGVVLPAGGAEDVRETAARIHAAVEEPFEIGGLALAVKASVGGVLFPDDASDSDTLVRFADAAMYAAKRNRSRVELYSPEAGVSSRESLTLGGELRHALDEGDIVVHYQPKVEVATGQLVGAEALVRWDHPERGIVAPAEFLPLVEKAGLMGALTTLVLRTAGAEAAAWARQGLDLGLAVNVDVGALLDPSFPDRVSEILDEVGLAPELLTIELTETSLMADPVRAGHVARELSSVGVRLSIDDFGTGYSSLGHLTALPLAELKVDRSFVGRMAESSTDMAIVRTILDLGSNLDLSVVAEGIESRRTRSILEGLGCPLAQGYAFGRPMPAAQLAALIARGGVRRRAAITAPLGA
ncbi:putative bifunctional diguanylate cyclase/phosphodiesterase [Gaiella sp.]|uniref:putative bifunctional diguanylate cyclase/phosphodiesterase n=1 Tax=Gaiella sp. TaxID=2663207 RepID=UPI002E36BA4F|nr:EAL domain-containing protein [Gaiella sp.]HEX5585332.1 EAL domain-containing protein [Gaiella sp.]